MQRTLHLPQLGLPAQRSSGADRHISQLIQHRVAAVVGAHLANQAELADAAPLQQHAQLQMGRQVGEQGDVPGAHRACHAAASSTNS